MGRKIMLDSDRDINAEKISVPIKVLIPILLTVIPSIMMATWSVNSKLNELQNSIRWNTTKIESMISRNEMVNWSHRLERENPGIKIPEFEVFLFPGNPKHQKQLSSK